MKDLLLEIINEAKDGKVIIDSETWPICFNTLLKIDDNYKSFINDNQNPVLFLENPQEFFELLKKYIDLEITINRRHAPFISDSFRNHQKLLIAYLFVNATTDDFLNPCTMLKNKIACLKQNPLNNFKCKYILDILPNSSLELNSVIDSIYMETPYKFDVKITNDNESYYLPSISYAIYNNTCHIYSVLNPKQEINTSYQKKIKRLLYKVNESAPEDVLNVSPSAVLSLSIFLKVLQLHNIKKVKVISYLPLRYLSRDLLANNRTDLIERNDFIQTNATNKLINTFNRLQYHDIIDITSYPYELDESLHLNIKDSSKNNNLLLSNINKKISK